ncbi:ADP-ribosylglycohydrolase family protein [Telmatocola sphagniphila]|uniref:ADP-ribosylglycohydrolase family protein n=1 Tax=Telmatocola sphagniphila TaxID=1123043 RepID=A0A8E6B462_9BACT|nr:ADP-ribosylglycohydrolase family protein [Telmatocola sphagniphila]QVL31007.1 ADP-ribosylglycohydrolase family protein [Telmatocola sphagniphila]
MLGSIVGDIIGSVHEGKGTKFKKFDLFVPHSCFTDDTVLTVAVADWLMTGGDLINTLQSWFLRYPNAGYGGMFISWALQKNREPYNSWANGSAMRVSPVAWAFSDLDSVLEKARESAEVTHNHPKGIVGAQATAAAIFLARTGHAKPEIKKYIETTFHYELSRSLREIRAGYIFDVSCAGSVPESIIAFLESSSYEDAVRNAISLGGDADTMACIAGGIAEAFYGGVPEEIVTVAVSRLDSRIRETLEQFQAWQSSNQKSQIRTQE